MSIESDARVTFGLLVKECRARMGWNRGYFARAIGTSFNVIKRMEHGVKNPSRQELIRAITVLDLPQEKLNEAYRLLRIFSPRRKKRFKFHFKCSNYSVFIRR